MEKIMPNDSDFKVESFEEYYGGIEDVTKTIDNCRVCETKLILTHISDYQNLYIEETARCPECGNKNRKVLHIIN
jgi:hypothetical protein